MDPAKSEPSSTKPEQTVALPSLLLARSAAGAKYLILLQIVSRALTFAVNQLLLRYLSPELLGISTQLEVYSISILFFSREALRVALQRQTDTSDEHNIVIDTEDTRDIIGAKRKRAAEETQVVVNLAFVSIILGIIFTFVLHWAYLRSLRLNLSVLTVPQFGVALQLYGLSAFLELLAEPSFAVVQQKSKYKVRAVAESVATVLRCAVTFGSTILARRNDLDIGVLPFALGQCAYSLSLLWIYVARVWLLSKKSGFSIVPKPIQRYKSPHICRTLMLTFLQYALCLWLLLQTTAHIRGESVRSGVVEAFPHSR